MRTRKHLAGLTLIEMMIALVIGMLLTVAAMAVYVGQSRVVVHQARKEQASQTGTLTYELLSRLLRHAETGSISITYGGSGAAAQPNATTAPELSSDSITIDFTLPSGYAVWPNDVSPYTDNAVRIAWSNTGANAYQVRVAKAASIGALGSATATTVAGSNTGADARILNLDYWPLQTDGRTLQTNAGDSPAGGYRLTLTTRAGIADPGYINPNDSSGPLKNYRTLSIMGAVVPRN